MHVILELPAAAAAKSLQSCLTLCDPIDGSQPASPVPRILQARTLEWVAISFSRSFLTPPQIRSRIFLLWIKSALKTGYAWMLQGSQEAFIFLVT